MGRALLVLLAVLVGHVAGIPEALALPAQRPAQELTALSFNIRHGAGPGGVVDLAEVAAEIRRSGADLVGLQEVDQHFGARSGFADQPAVLAGLLGMRWAYAPNIDLDPLAAGTPRRHYGVAVLSRFPIVTVRHTLLPRGGPSEEQRGLLEAVVDVGGTAVRFMTTHLEVSSAAARAQQAQVVAAAVVRSPEPVVLTGDLNAQPDTPAVATLTALLRDSEHRDGGFTMPAAAPAMRIDYVLCRGACRETSTVLDTRVSDHRPVLARLLLGRD